MRLNKTLNEGNLDAALELSYPDALVRGFPGVRGLGELDRWRIEIEGLIDAGPEVVIAAVTTRGVGDDPGSEARKLFHVFRFRDGRLSELHACPDFLAALSAAGIDDSLD